MTLSEAQCVFTLLVSKLISYTYSLGYQLTLGEATRPPEMAILYCQRGTGIANSLHCDRLALDLNLYVNGHYMRDGSHAGYKAMGNYWKSLHPQCAWGGDFTTRHDANHFSFAFGGRK